MEAIVFKDIVISNRTYTKLNISNSQTLDNIALKVIKQDTPDFLMPIKVINIDNEVELRYEIGRDLRFSYLSTDLSKSDFLNLMQSLLRPFKECSDWMLDYHKFYLKKEYITVGKTLTDIKYIYIPDENFSQSDEEIVGFFRDFIFSVNVMDKSYVLDLLRALNAPSATLGTLFDFMEKEAVNSDKDTKKNISTEISSNKKSVEIKQNPPKVEESIGRDEEKEQVEEEKEEPVSNGGYEEDDIQRNLMEGLFGEGNEEEEPKEKKRGLKREKPTKKEKPVKKEKPEKNELKEKGGILSNLFAGSKTKQENKEEVVQARSYVDKREPVQFDKTEYSDNLNSDSTLDATCIDGDEEMESNANVLVLELLDDGGYQFPKRIELDLRKGYVMVGRYDKSGMPQADYNFDGSLSFISRKHFRIEKRAGELVIIDVGSGNGTFLNDEMLVVNMTYPLNTGDKIILAKKQRITYRVC